jgi:hypothetical protein
MPALKSIVKARPVDQATRDPALLAVRDSLIDIVARRDSAALSRHISPKVRYNFGVSNGGPAGFFATYKGQMPLLWSVLDDVLRHGGTLEGNRFWAPWTMDLPNGLSVEEYAIVRDSNVVVYASADSVAGMKLGTLSFDVVKLSGTRWDDIWTGIRLEDGRTGFVQSQHIRSPMQWRLAIDRYQGRWMIGLLLSGD